MNNNNKKNKNERFVELIAGELGEAKTTEEFQQICDALIKRISTWD